ncbi:FlaD/FlaE family flagellar protein [Thermococcus sp.]
MITEIEIDERLKKLKGKVPNVLIDDLREKLLNKKDILSPEQVDKIIERVIQTYSSQLTRLINLDRRVEEIGKYLEEIRSLLLEKKGTPNTSVSTAHPQEAEPSAPELIESEVEAVEKEGKAMEKGFEIPPEIKESLIVPHTPSNGRARLEKIPQDMASTLIALKWLGFLIDRVGMQNLEQVLEFYYEIGWISEDVLNTMLKYANGTKPHHREPNWRPEDKLTIQDHLISLLFIERLRGVRITREVLDSIEREMKVINRVLEEVYGV